MKSARSLLAAAIALAFGAGLAVGASFDDALDPVKAAPHIYEVALENERVRVLEVSLRDGEMAPLHSHPDHLVVYLSACGWLETTGDGQERMQSYTIGDVTWEPGMMHGGEPANVIHDCRLLYVELKESPDY